MVPTWDLVLFVFGGASIVYGLMLRERIIVTLLGAYAGMIVADRWGETIFRLVTDNSPAILNQDIVSGNISVLTMQIAIFVIVMLIIALKGGVLIHPESLGIGIMPHVVLMLYGFLGAMLVASAILGFLPQDQLAVIYENSKWAQYLVDYQSWVLMAPLVVMIFSGWGSRN